MLRKDKVTVFAKFGIISDITLKIGDLCFYSFQFDSDTIHLFHTNLSTKFDGRFFFFLNSKGKYPEVDRIDMIKKSTA